MVFIKKKLQKIADKSMESANNIEFKQKIENMLEEKNEKKACASKKLIWALSSVATILVIICLVMAVVLPANKQATETPHYAFEFEKTEEVFVEELNNNLKGFFVNNNIENTYITRIYDDKSKDTLMFVYVYDNLDAFNSINMHIVTNPYYTDRVYANKIFDKSIDYYGNLLEYKEKVEEIDGIFEYNIEGKLFIKQITIYFKYQNFAFEEDSGMLEMLDTIIKFN